MSYSRSYHNSVQYSGSVNYSYPASQSGGSGSISYSGSVPVDINIEVDTRPFDSSVKGTHAALAGVAGAVTGMEAAQCAAIQKTGQDVSQTAIHGFYTLINSELSQQITECNSMVKSKFALMVEQSKSVSELHDQMNTDFTRIKSRYTSVFANLDEECEKRITALDSTAFTLANKMRKDLLTTAYTQNAGFAYGQIPEEAVSKITLTVARLRSRVSDVINVFSDSAYKSLRYKMNMDHILGGPSPSGNVQKLEPVVYAEESGVENEESDITCFSPDQNCAETVASSVKKALSETQPEKWQNMTDAETEIIDKSFNALAEQFLSENGADRDRLYSQILSMWKNNRPSTLYSAQ